VSHVDKRPGEERGAAAESIGMVALMLLFGGIVLAIYPGWATVGTWFESANAAAWVQAIGSVVAIAATAGVANYQASQARKLAEHQRIASEIQKLSLLVGLFARTHGLAKDVVTAINDPTAYNFSVIDPELMQDTADTMRSLPLFEIPSGLVALDVRACASHLEKLIDYWNQITSESRETGVPPTAETIANLSVYCEEMMKVSHAALTEAKQKISARGGKWS
jgi:hypothetical protein